jgi:endogenous inhibitor of DNA gyrase (YacG/DUF329 family)
MQRRCPVCKKEIEWEGNPWRPFCSERCRITDLGKWAADEYRIPGEKIDHDKQGEDEKNDGDAG